MSSATHIRNSLDRRRHVQDLALMAHSNFDEKASPTKSIFSIALFVVFFAALLISLIVGINVYSNAIKVQQSTNTQREDIQLITNIIRANDSENVVGIGQGPEGKALVLAENLSSGTYETRIYKYNGNIVQEYSLATNAYTPERASVIVASESFGFSYEDGLLTINTDNGSAEIALRYLQGVA